MPKSRGRGRKRKASPSPDAEDNSGVAGVKETIVSTNRGKYVPRFGNAAKKQRVDVGGKKLNREVSDEGEEDVLLPISSTQPVGGARDADMAGEWSSTQPAPKLATDVQAGADTDSLIESQHNIPNAMETKENEECFVPGLALSQSLPHSTHQSLKCGEDTNTEFTNITQNKDHTNDGHCGDAVDTNTAESDTKCYNEEEVDDKCLDLLNPLGVDSDDDVDGDSVEDGHCSQPPITAVCTPPADSHTSAVVRWPRDNGAEDALLPNSGSDQAIPEPIVDSFYTDSSQENKGKPGGSSSSGVQEEIHSDDPPLACTSDEAEEAMREMEGLRAVDLQESQLFAVATEDQTAPEPGPSPVAAKRRLVCSDGKPCVCSQDMPLQEGTRIMQGLIDELSTLKFILHCKKELETALRQRRGTRHIPHHQHPSGLHSGRKHPTHTHW